MKRLLAAVFVMTPTLAQAVEFGIIRPLQHGPIGDSPQFIDVKNLEVEGALLTTQVWGKNKINDDNERQVNAFGYNARLGAGGAWSLSRDFYLTGYATATFASDFDERQTRGEKDSAFDSGLYRHEFAGYGVYKANPFVIGGGVGLMVMGEEKRLLRYGEPTIQTNYYQEVSRAYLPVLRLFTGIETKTFDGSLGARFFSMGDAVVSSYDKEDGGKKTGEYDVSRRNPGEIHLDGRLKLDELTLAGSLAYVFYGQASENVNEWSNRYIQDGGTKVRDTGNDRLHQDQYRLAIGGRFDPSKTVGLLGGLSYLSSFYAKPEYASVEHENLGGVRADLGGELNFKPFNGYLQMGYLLDNRVSWTQKTDARTPPYINATQRFPLQAGDRVKTSQGRWDIALGGGMVF